MVSPSIDDVSAVVLRVGSIPAVGADEDIFEAGMSSVNALQLLLELETAFDLTIPDEEFVAARTPRALATLIARLSNAS